MAEPIPQPASDPESLRREKVVPASEFQRRSELRRAQDPDPRRKALIGSGEADQVVDMEEARKRIGEKSSEKDRVADILDGYDPEPMEDQADVSNQALPKRGMVQRARDWWMNIVYPYLTALFVEDVDKEKQNDED